MAKQTVEITMPRMGESVTEGTVLEWHKQVGQAVSADETLVEVSTDKVDAEVPAPADGVLTEILAGPDEIVEAGSVLGTIEVGATAATNGGEPDAPPAGADAPTAADGAESGDAAEGAAAAATDGPEGAAAPPTADEADGAGAPAAATDGPLLDLVLPRMGESVNEGTVLEWHKAVGDTVAADETLVEVSTDKVDAEVPSPAAGTLAEILVQPDETVEAGAVLGRIAVGAAAPANGPSAPETSPEPAAAPTLAPTGNGRGSGGDVTPVAERIARAEGLDLASVPGTGPRGRVTKEDVLKALSGNGAPAAATPSAPQAPAQAPVAPPPAPAGASTKPLRGPAATLARFMNESLTIPTATSFRTIPVDVLDERRRVLKGAGKRLSFTHLIAWAIVRAAREAREMAQAYTEIDGKPHVVIPGGLGLGLAVDVERKDGSRFLVTPALTGADGMDFNAFVARYDELVAGARDGTLGADDYVGANLTLTNPGGLGTVASVPRLMPGQGTILATGAIGFPPGFARANPAKLRELGVTKVMTVTSTYDHRVIQGAQSGAFLRRLDQLLQGEDGFYDELFAAVGVSTASAPAAEPGQATAAEPVPASVTPTVSSQPDEGLLQAVQAATSVVKAHRTHGHLAARLDPLGAEPAGDPALDPESVSLTPELMAMIPARILRMAVPGETFAEALPRLQEIYCGTIAYEIEHLSDHQERVWLRQTIESGELRAPLEAHEQRRLLERLLSVSALENYLRRTFLGKKTFSVEGLDMLVPMLDESIELTAADGGREVVIGMAHRGRLNVLAHTVGRPYERILVEFEGEQNPDVETALPMGGTGDVKYHHGAAGTFKAASGKSLTVTLSPNPSHLEFVDPVVEGRARADQTSRKARELRHDPTLVLPVLIHGDAAFPGQGVVPETLNLSGLKGYSTGGTLHIITNNQVGFTTDPPDARSTRYASDLAKGFDIPIVHVNADDVEACVAAVRLAVTYRKTFGRDFVIDLIGYRRFGHNETDEPAYTQPAMYERIKRHPPVAESYGKRLTEDGAVTPDELAAMREAAQKRLTDAHAALRVTMERNGHADSSNSELDRTETHEPRTAVSADILRELNEQLFTLPEGFSMHRKLRPQIDKRLAAVRDDDGRLDWAHAEQLAFASLLAEGVPVRLTGQDSERGTFSQRHLVFHDAKSGERATPIQELRLATAPFELHNSPLSEIATMGFEYGYSVQAPEALVLWEGQFGDFVNGAQVIVDQFLVSGLAKWGQTTRLTLLLPHGYEGSGPEHSSARLERFLQLGSEGNIRVANCTTPAQYFHLLRRQALIERKRPLVVMTPKSLLRAPDATSSLADLTGAGFQAVLEDPKLPGGHDQVTRLVLCSGKVFYDLVGHPDRAEAAHVAVGRVELLYPFAERELRDLIGRYPSVKEVVWAQEEPRNMGARFLMMSRLAHVLGDGIELSLVSRPLRASPSEGYSAAHLAEQARIVREALGFPEDIPAELEAMEQTMTADPGGDA